MYKFLTKNGQLLAFGLGALLAILFLIFWLGGQESLDALPKETKYTTGIFDVGLLGSFGYFIIAALLAVGFAIYQTATNFRESLQSIIGIVAMVAIFVVSYSLSQPDHTGIVGAAAVKMGVSDSTQKLLGGGLTTMYVMFGLAVLALVASEVRNIFK